MSRRSQSLPLCHMPQADSGSRRSRYPASARHRLPAIWLDARGAVARVLHLNPVAAANPPTRQRCSRLGSVLAGAPPPVPRFLAPHRGGKVATVCPCSRTVLRPDRRPSPGFGWVAPVCASRSTRRLRRASPDPPNARRCGSARSCWQPPKTRGWPSRSGAIDPAPARSIRRSESPPERQSRRQTARRAQMVGSHHSDRSVGVSRS